MTPQFAEVIALEHVAFLRGEGLTWFEIYRQAADACRKVFIVPDPVTSMERAVEAFAAAWQATQRVRVGLRAAE